MHRSVSTLATSALLFISLAACSGDAGPMGPSGPAGPAGPGTRIVLSATVDSRGGATVSLPAAAGTPSSPPAMACYLNQPGTTSYLLIGTDLSGPTCGLVTSGTALQAVMIAAPATWRATFVIVY